mgnify:CR=1 FL=1
MTRLKAAHHQLHEYADPQSIERGEQYFARGAVRPLRVRGQVLEADVEGSMYEPYRVRVTFDEAGVVEAACSCPYEWSGWCKHIVAALLAYLDAPDEVEERPALEDRLAELDEEQRERLLLNLLRDPEIADAIERHLDRLEFQQSGAEVARGRRSSVDVEAFRRSVRHDFRSSGYGYDEYYYGEGGGISLDEPLAQIRAFVDGGDSANALALLEVLTDELADMIDHEYIYSEGIDWWELDSVWCEALLIGPLSRAERQRWGKKLLKWDEPLDAYGWGGALGGAQLAAEQGLDGPILEAWRRGERSDDEEIEDRTALQHVAEALLAALERQGEDDTFLNVARATDHGLRYLLKLIGLERGEQAVQEADTWLRTPDDALTVAKALREQGNMQGALRAAEQGLSLESLSPDESPWLGGWGPAPVTRYALATWLADLAEGMGRREVALRATVIAFREQPSVALYEQVQALSGEAWEREYHSALLQVLRSRQGYGSSDASSTLFLREGRLEDAMRVAEGTHEEKVVRRVMEGVLGAHPGWVIEQALKRAEPIMDQGKSGHYHEAVTWLRHARDAYRAMNRDDEWRRYLADLKQTHGRKYKLMGLMRGL